MKKCPLETPPRCEKKVGRPRDEKVRTSVLEAVRARLHHTGLCGMTMEGIAKEAGVGKQTLYRWWPTLPDVALEALIDEVGTTCVLPETGDLRGDLRAYLRGAFRMTREHTGPLLRCLMADAQKNSDFGTRFREQFIQVRREALGALLSRHAPNLAALDPLVDMLLGALWLRLMVGHLPLDDGFADQLAEAAAHVVQRR